MRFPENEQQIFWGAGLAKLAEFQNDTALMSAPLPAVKIVATLHL